jgi:hypothetical protein
MKVMFSAIALLALTTSAEAARHINSRGMSCASVRSSVASHGAVILHHGAGLYAYVVAHGGYCAHGQTTRPYWVPTRDSRACFAGYTCEMQDSSGGE